MHSNKKPGYDSKKIINSTEGHKLLNKWKTYLPRKRYAIIKVSITKLTYKFKALSSTYQQELYLELNESQVHLENSLKSRVINH